MNRINLYILLIILLISFSGLYSEKAWVKVKDISVSYENYRLLDCLDSNNCYAMGDFTQYVTMFKSTDQGKTWFELFDKYDDDTLHIGEVFRCKIKDENHIYINHLDGLQLGISKDGGKTFESVFFGEYSGSFNIWFIEISMFTNQIGAGLTRRLLIHTKDSWGTNTIVKIPDSINAKEPIFFIDSNNIAFNRYDGYNVDFIKYNIKNKEWSIWGRGEKKRN